MSAYHVELDIRGMNCPLPVVKTNQQIQKMKSGQVLRVIAADQNSTADIETFCRETGNKLISKSFNGGNYEFCIRRH